MGEQLQRAIMPLLGRGIVLELPSRMIERGPLFALAASLYVVGTSLLAVTVF